MTSEVRFNQVFDYWWSDLRWCGIFNLQWLFIKDIDFDFHFIKKLSFYNKNAYELKDGYKIDFQIGWTLLSYFQEFKARSTIFEDFAFMDEREEKLREHRDKRRDLFLALRSIKNQESLLPLDISETNKHDFTENDKSKSFILEYD